LTYRQYVCRSIWNDVFFEEMWAFTFGQKEQRHLGQPEDCLFCASLVTCTCNVWRNAFSRNCWGIWRYFKPSLDTLTSNDNGLYQRGTGVVRYDYGAVGNQNVGNSFQNKIQSQCWCKNKTNLFSNILSIQHVMTTK